MIFVLSKWIEEADDVRNSRKNALDLETLVQHREIPVRHHRGGKRTIRESRLECQRLVALKPGDQHAEHLAPQARAIRAGHRTRGRSGSAR